MALPESFINKSPFWTLSNTFIIIIIIGTFLEASNSCVTNLTVALYLNNNLLFSLHMHHYGYTILDRP